MRVLNIGGRESAAMEEAAEASTRSLLAHSLTHSLTYCSALSFGEAKMSCSNDGEESDRASSAQNGLTLALHHIHHT